MNSEKISRVPIFELLKYYLAYMASREVTCPQPV